MTPDYFVAWMMVFLRSLGIVIQIPSIAGHALPALLRMGLCACIATLLTGIIPSGGVPLTLWALGLAAAGEVILGLLMGFIMRTTFEAVEMAGRTISPEIGLSPTHGIGIPEPASEPVASLLSAFSVVCFFLLRGHQMMLSAFAHSFHMAPAGHASFDHSAPESLIRATGYAIELSVRMAAPFIGMNFLVTLAFSVMGRAVPKMNVFAVSMSLRALAGLGLLGTAGALLMRYLFIEFEQLPLRMIEVLPVR
jgi:flagellar biosynthetic protein FliR